MVELLQLWRHQVRRQPWEGREGRRHAPQAAVSGPGRVWQPVVSAAVSAVAAVGPAPALAAVQLEWKYWSLHKSRL